MKKETRKPLFRQILVKEIKVDGLYQRDLKEDKVKKIVGNFDIGLLGVLICSKRKDGYYVIDGQHRLEALNILNVDLAMCSVHYDLTVCEEAELFVKYNKNRLALTPYDIFNASLQAGDKSSIELNQAVINSGLSIGKKSGYKTIGSVGTLVKLHKKYNMAHLMRSLHLIRKTWQGKKDSFNASIIQGMVYFVSKCDSYFKDSLFISKMSKFTLNELKAAGRNYRKTTYVEKSFGRAIFDYYNSGRTTKRIPEKVMFD